MKQQRRISFAPRVVDILTRSDLLRAHAQRLDEARR
jgi:hypothetical protein